MRAIQISKAPIDKWIQIIDKPFAERMPYEKNEDYYHITQVTGRILGVPHDETDYLMQLYELSKKSHVVVLSEELDKTITPERFQAIQKIHMINQKENGLSINRFVAFLDGERLLPSHPNSTYHRHIRQSFMSILRHFEARHGLAHADFRRVLLDMIKWIWNHLDPWLQSFDLDRQLPCVIWYGEMNKSQQYFLYYLMMLGFDVLVFHPEGTDSFADMDEQEDVAEITRYPMTMTAPPFPIEQPERRGTVAYRASKEMDEVIHHEGSSLYKPWQFRNYVPSSVTLKTTYDEVFLLAKERAFIRPNFKVQQGVVHIPAIFAKVMGVSRNKKEYWDRLHQLTELNQAITVQNFPFTQHIQTNYQFHYQHALNHKGELDVEKMIKGNWWQYGHLPEGMQRGIASAIASICRNPKLLPIGNETEKDVQLYLFTQVANMPKTFLNVMQTFDYAQEIPKVVLYNNEINGALSRSDAALLLLLNEFGMDIIVYNPPGHNDLEQYIDSSCFDTHWLDDMVFNQEYKEPSLLKRVFRSIKI
ncbi:YceG family protein [Metabacillus iocasae]|uniref:Putative component of 'biosynthetic module' domain-containing protein n=1 Tax=Priestia iocasae TaxID=2291674 RepID=A0ABS2QSQ2_9BACI|nr:YceG family protein [Metabacillus iocasae]MBM7702486.1 hypothetical protein [Metabacillus iocasae]